MGEWIISASVLIVIVAAIRCFFRNKLSIRMRYALWLVVALRLLIPVAFAESSFSILNFPIFKETAAGNGTTAAEREAAMTGNGTGAAEREAAIAGNGTGAAEGETAIAGKGTGAAEGETAIAGSGTGAARQESSESRGVTVLEPQPLWDTPADSLNASDEVTNGNMLENEIYTGNREDIFGNTTSSVSGNTYGNAASSENGNTHGNIVSSDRGITTGDIGFPDNGKITMPDAGWRSRLGELSVLTFVWMAGSFLSLGTMIIVNGNYRRRVYRSRKRYQPEAESRLPVYVSPVIGTPCMFGLFRPAVYLPLEAAEEGKSLEYILCHENTHYRHRDNLWVIVRALCVCIHWYNPLVWIAADLSRQDCELACDEVALETLGEDERIPYGRTLLDFSAQGYVPFNRLRLSTAMSGRKKQLEERLLMIVGQSGRHMGAMAAVCVLTLLASLVTFTGRANGQELKKDAAGDETDSAAGADRESETEKETAGLADMQETDSYPGGTFIVPVDLGDEKQYVLKISSEAVQESGEYRVDQIVLNRIEDRTEETLQTINLKEARVLYTRSLEDIKRGDGKMWSYSTEEEPQYAKPLYTVDDLPVRAAGQFLTDTDGELVAYSLSGGILVEDLNFDGYQDFCLQGKTEGVNIPYYCYLWNPAEGCFDPGYMIPNLQADREAQLLESATDDGDGVYSTKYYSFDEQNILHMVRYVEDNQSPGALFPFLDLTYGETSYSLPAVDEWDYGTRYGGAMTERFVYWAKQALTELYEWSGTKIDTASFTVTQFGDVVFGNTVADLHASRTYYSREYGAKAGFESCIEQMWLSTERTVWYSPVTLWTAPDNAGQMTDMELAEWYFAHCPLTEGETLEEINQSYSDTYTVRAESGNYYEVILDLAAREIMNIAGPYEKHPNH